MTPAEAVMAGHDLDYDCPDKIPDEQGYYDNGWQLASIWCRTHKRYEWHWIELKLLTGRLPT